MTKRLGLDQQALRKLADDGDSEAAYQLGLMHRDLGYCKEAVRWFERAAKAGHTEAGYQAGLMHRDLGYRMDAVRWFERAAKAGHTEAGYQRARI